jgi:uncharacterized membrane protein
MYRQGAIRNADQQLPGLAVVAAPVSEFAVVQLAGYVMD